MQNDIYNMETVNPVILKTTNYDLFKDVISNREVNRPHLNRLIKAIKAKNLLSLNPIKVDSEMRVYDGQHRLAAAKALNLEIFYQVSDAITTLDISVLNSNTKNWVGEDYLNFYVVEDKQDYKRIAEFMNKYPEFNLTLALQLLHGFGGHGSLLQPFKQGLYTVTTFDDAVRFAEAIAALKEFGDFIYHSTFCRVFMEVFDHDKFLLNTFIAQIKKTAQNILPLCWS